jgi:hypothetical protein
MSNSKGGTSHVKRFLKKNKNKITKKERKKERKKVTIKFHRNTPKHRRGATSLQPARTRRQSTNIYSDNRKLDAELASIRASLTGRFQSLLSQTTSQGPQSTVDIQYYMLHMAKKYPAKLKDIFQKSNYKNILQTNYNKWITQRRSGSPTSHTFQDSIIKDSAVFKRLLNSSKGEKMAKLVINVKSKPEPEPK